MRPFRLELICRAPSLHRPSVARWRHPVLAHVSVRSYQQVSPSDTQAEGTPSSIDRHIQEDINTPSLSSIEPKDSPAFQIQKVPYDRKRTRSQKVPYDGKTSQTQEVPYNGKSTGTNGWAHPALNPDIPSPGPRTWAARALAKGEDYTAVVMEPKAKRKSNTSDLPWFVPSEGEHADPMDRLALEIAKFYDYAKPSDYDAEARENVVFRVQKAIRSVYPNCHLELFGSEKNGLALALSDIDLRIAIPTESGKIPTFIPGKFKPKLMHMLQSLNKHFQDHKQYANSEVFHARFPLLSMHDCCSGIVVQIVSSPDTSKAQEAVSTYKTEYPYIVELYSVIKSAFLLRGLTNVFLGGVGAYPLFMMIVASLRHNPPARQDAAGGLLSFLEFWSSFDTKKGLSIEPPVTFDKDAEPISAEIFKLPSFKRLSISADAPTQPAEASTQPTAADTQSNETPSPPHPAPMESDNAPPQPHNRPKLPPYMLSLRDPADPTNDLGRKTASIKHFQATCAHLLSTLRQSLQTPGSNQNTNTNPDTPAEEATTTPTTLLDPLIGPIFDLHRSRRYNLAKRGAHVKDLRAQGAVYKRMFGPGAVIEKSWRRG